MGIDHIVQKKVFDEIDMASGEMIEYLQELVRTPSISGLEKPAQTIVNEKLMSMNLKTDVFDAEDVPTLKNHPEFFETIAYKEYGYRGRPNVVGKLKGSGKGRSLILSGHIDVVPPDPVDSWTYDPWGAQIESGKLYGRGALDMKGGIAAMTYALRSILKSGIKLKGDVTVETTIEEESGGIGGVLATILRGYRADAAILTEPHYDNIQVATAGVRWFKILVPGQIAHASRAHLGVNAIMKAMKICNALTVLNEDRQKRVRYQYIENVAPHMKGRSTTINIGTIKGGNWPSTVPGWVELQCRINHPPNEDTTDVIKEIEETVEKVKTDDPWLKDHPPKVEWFGWRSRPHEQDVNHPIVKMVKKHAEEFTGKSIRFTGGHAGNDARFFVLFGHMPAILYGPAGSDTHCTDEYVEINTVVGTAKILSLTILDWCGYEEP